MKKLVFMLAATAMAASASAQTVTESKTFDNIYVGVNGGVATKLTGHAWLKGLDPNAGIRVGRYFTPVFGMAVEGNAYFSNKPFAPSLNTFVRAHNVSALATVNLTNLFGGYKGEPRLFELSAVGGLGWAHVYGSDSQKKVSSYVKKNSTTSKVGLDFAFNLGKEKALQLYVEPAVIWGLNGFGEEGVQYNVNKGFAQLNAGVIYKFKNSNGTHNFTIAQLRDQAEIDNLNNQINELHNEIAGKDDKLAGKNQKLKDLQNALDECVKKPVKTATQTNLQPTVLFRQGKSVVDKAQLANVELIANYMKNHPDAKITIKGYASPEGSKEINDKISNDRANNVKDILVKQYKVEAERINAYGEGATDKLFKQVEFNRVATFNDDAAVEE